MTQLGTGWHKLTCCETGKHYDMIQSAKAIEKQ